MCKLPVSPVSGNVRRSFRLIDPSTVAVKIGNRTTRYILAVGVAADCEGNPETVVSLRAGRERFHVTLARDGSAMCHCHNHFDAGHCWHADLAAAIVERLGSGKPEEPKAPTLEVVDAGGSPLCSIISESGLCRSHHKLAELIQRKPWLLANREQVEALAASIAGTRIEVRALAAA